MKHQLSFFALLALLLFTACEKEKATPPCEPGVLDPNCLCIAVYDPVCGCDGVTYSNACAAGCANVGSFTEGACGD